MSPRWYDKRTGDHLALDTGGGPLARLWATALAGLVETPYVKPTGNEREDHLPKTAPRRRDGARVEDPAVGQHDRARSRARLLHRLRGGDGAVTSSRRRSSASARATSKVFEDFKVPDEAIGCGFHEAVRGVLSHHLVIRDGKIANYHPYPPTPWNASPRDSYGTPGPYEDAVQGMPIFEENGPDNFKGIDIMRTVRSFDPCLPCGVHMYLGNGKVLEAAALADVRRTARIGRRPWTISKHASESRRSRPSWTRRRRCPIRRPASSASSSSAALLDLYGEALDRLVASGGRSRRARGRRARRASPHGPRDPPGAGRGPRARRARRGPAVSRVARRKRRAGRGRRRRRPAPPRRELRWVSLVRDDARRSRSRRRSARRRRRSRRSRRRKSRPRHVRERFDDRARADPARPDRPSREAAGDPGRRPGCSHSSGPAARC